MPTHRSQLYTRADLARLLELVNANARSRWPDPAYLLSSDVAWRLPGSRGDLRLWFDDDGLAAYAWFALITPSVFDLRGDLDYDSPVAVEVLQWLQARRRQFKPLVPWLIGLRSMREWERALDTGTPLADGRDTVLQVGAFEGDGERIAYLRANGFQASEHFNYYLARSLDVSIPAASLPDGWCIRRAEAADLAARVAVHRESWHKSRFTVAQYHTLRGIDVFDGDLDLVAQTPAGELVSYCIGWVDHATGVGSFEPVGTPPAWRRRGLGRQVQYEGLRRMKAKGMRHAKVGTAGFNDRAYGLYTSCGFTLSDRERTYIKVL